MASRAAESADLFDAFTVAHLATGYVSGMAGVPMWAVVVGALALDALEEWSRKRHPDCVPRSSGLVTRNAALDVLAAIVGAVVGQRKRCGR